MCCFNSNSIEPVMDLARSGFHPRCGFCSKNVGVLIALVGVALFNHRTLFSELDTYSSDDRVGKGFRCHWW